LYFCHYSSELLFLDSKKHINTELFDKKACLIIIIKSNINNKEKYEKYT